MILQTDKRFATDPELTPYGCHFMAELFLLNKLANIELSVGIILAALNTLRSQEASYQGEQPDPLNPIYVIGSECTVNNPDDIVSYFHLQYRTSARMEAPSYLCQPDEQELLQWERPGWVHWVTGDGKGNVAYDPEGYSVTVREGNMVAKKIFAVIAPG